MSEVIKIDDEFYEIDDEIFKGLGQDVFTKKANGVEVSKNYLAEQLYTHKGYNIIRVGRSIYAIRQGISVDTGKLEEYLYENGVETNAFEEGSLFRSKTVYDIKRMIDNYVPSSNPEKQLALDEALELVKKYLDQNDLQSAEKLSRQILQASPNNPQALHLLGKVAHKAKYYQDAVKLMQQAINQNPVLLDVYYDLAIIFYELGQYNDTLKCYQIGIAKTFNIAPPPSVEDILIAICKAPSTKLETYKEHYINYVKCLRWVSQQKNLQTPIKKK